jgi:hypothetical protein
MNSILTLTPSQRAELYQAASQKLGIGEIIIEKDFWVCWTLQQLFLLPGIASHLIFKGGTSLSKAWGVITRFSEDIDVSLGRDWLGFSGEHDPEAASSKNKRKDLIKELAEACAAKIKSDILPALQKAATEALGTEGWNIEIDANEPQTVLFRYPTALGKGEAEEYVRREVKIEFGARSDAWPAEEKIIVPYVAEAFPETTKDAATTVHVLSIQRTFWEKATILHAEFHRPKESPTPARFSRHYADLAALADHASAAESLKNTTVRDRVVEHKKVFFASKWASYETAVPGKFRLVPPDNRLAALETDYRAMAEMYFKTPRPWSEIIERLRTLENAINRSEKALSAELRTT